MSKDFYKILGVPKSASADEIKKAYRSLSKELHPDKHKGDKAAEQKFKDVNEAYEVLGNAQKRQMYDQFGSAGPGGAGFGGGGGGFGGFDFSGFAGGGSQRMDFSDLFENFFTGGARSGGRREAKGDDKEVAIEITFAESVTGADRRIRIKRLAACDRCKGNGAEQGAAVKTCGECNGTGQVMRTAQSFFGVIQQATVCGTCRGSGKVPEKPCKDCSGEGRLQKTEEITVQIPAGIDTGQTLRMRGYGDAGRQGTPAGDLFIHVQVREDERFERDGADIRSRLELPAVDAILGTEIQLETVLGKVTLAIPAGTQPGQVLRIRGKGMPILNGSGHGDHYVTVDVNIPAKLSKKERELLEEWKKLQ